MFCRFCGVQLQPNVKFCNACGKKVESFTPPSPAEMPAAQALPYYPKAEENTVHTPVPAGTPTTFETTTDVTGNIPAASSAENNVEPSVREAVTAAPPVNVITPPAAGFTVHPPVSPQKRGSHKVPLAIMAVLFVIGLGVYILTQFFPPYTAPMQQEELRSETPGFYMEDGELYFDSTAYDGPAEITVPGEVDGQTVTALADGCFAGNETLTTVILPDTLQVIGPDAFADCTSMRGIYIPDNVTVIGAGAFRGCTNLEAIDLPGTIATIGHEAFQDCEKLEHIFFDGKKSQWKDLYTEKIGPNTQVYCTNGTLKQGRGKA